MPEEWRDVPGVPYLQVSSLGNARTLKHVMLRKNGSPLPTHGGPLRPSIAGHGYRHIRHKNKTYKIGNLVALAFIGQPPSSKHQVRHWDDVKTNDRLTNLLYGTKKQNQEDRLRNGIAIVGSAHPNSKITEADVREIKRRLSKGESSSTISLDYPVRPATIDEIRRGNNWKHVT